MRNNHADKTCNRIVATAAVAIALALSTTAPVFADGYAAENARCSVQMKLAVDKLQSIEGDNILDAKRDVRSFYAPRLKSCVMVRQRRDQREAFTQKSWVDPTSFSDRGRATIYADYAATEDGALDNCFFYRDASAATRIPTRPDLTSKYGASV